MKKIFLVLTLIISCNLFIPPAFADIVEIAEFDAYCEDIRTYEDNDWFETLYYSDSASVVGENLVYLVNAGVVYLDEEKDCNYHKLSIDILGFAGYEIEKRYPDGYYSVPLSKTIF